MGRWEAETRARSGPELVLHFDRELFFFTLCWKKCLVTLHGYYWQASILLPMGAWT